MAAKIEWVNNGEAVDGKFTATIQLEGATGIQRFEGESHKEVADKLLQAQANATEKIRTMAKAQKPEPAKPSKEIVPVPLTAVDRVNIARDIVNPETAPEAIRKVVESAVGPLDQVRDQLNANTEEDQARDARQAAYEFTQETPEYFICDHNRNTMVAYMKLHGMDPLQKENFILAFEQLKAENLLVFKPENAAPPTPEAAGGFPETPSNTRPRGAVSTGLRSVDSTVPTRTVNAKPKYTRQDIEAMSEDTYKDKIRNERGFREFVDSLPG